MLRLTLGGAIRQNRLKAGWTLRGFAVRVRISPAHLSDIEHNHRRPSRGLLAKIAKELTPAGVSLNQLDRLLPRLEPDIREWLSETPEARHMLRAVKESGRDPRQVLLDIERMLKRRGKKQ